MQAFSPLRDPEKRSNSHYREQIRRLISAGSEAGSLQVVSTGTFRLSRYGGVESSITVTSNAENITERAEIFVGPEQSVHG